MTLKLKIGVILGTIGLFIFFPILCMLTLIRVSYLLIEYCPSLAIIAGDLILNVYVYIFETVDNLQKYLRKVEDEASEW